MRKRRKHKLTLHLPDELLDVCEEDGIDPERHGCEANLAEVVLPNASPDRSMRRNRSCASDAKSQWSGAARTTAAALKSILPIA